MHECETRAGFKPRKCKRVAAEEMRDGGGKDGNAGASGGVRREARFRCSAVPVRRGKCSKCIARNGFKDGKGTETLPKGEPEQDGPKTCRDILRLRAGHTVTYGRIGALPTTIPGSTVLVPVLFFNK